MFIFMFMFIFFFSFFLFKMGFFSFFSIDWQIIFFYIEENFDESFVDSSLKLS